MKTVLVAAGVLIENGQVLLSQRKVGSHLAGTWEFPGGKVEDGEDPKVAVARELLEELGIEVTVGDALEVTFHRYDTKAVLLLFYACQRTASSAAPVAIDVAAFRWSSAADMAGLEFPPADVSIVRKVTTLLSA